MVHPVTPPASKDEVAVKLAPPVAVISFKYNRLPVTVPLLFESVTGLPLILLCSVVSAAHPQGGVVIIVHSVNAYWVFQGIVANNDK